jgi:hypothetical protein
MEASRKPVEPIVRNESLLYVMKSAVGSKRPGGEEDPCKPTDTLSRRAFNSRRVKICTLRSECQLETQEEAILFHGAA